MTLRKKCEVTMVVESTHGSILVDRERLSPSPDPLPHRSLKEETKPVPRDPHCIHDSATLNASAGDALLQQTRPLHVQFDAESLSAPVEVSSSLSTNNEKLSTTTARSPDGGWGWVIVFASFMINLIISGIDNSFALLFPYILEHFNEGRGLMGRIMSIFIAMSYLSGPIASFLIDKYGCRWMTIFGAVLCFLGFVTSTFVDNMDMLYLTFGVLAGFGVSLCQVAAVVIVAYYFEKKRSLATGISMCGSGISIYIFGPLTKILLDKYKWRVTVLILAGILLNMAVCGLLFRDLPWMTMTNEERVKKRNCRRERKRNKHFGSSADSFPDSKSSAVGSTKVSDAVDIEALAKSTAPQHSSLDNLPYMTRGEGVSLETFELRSARGQGEEKMQWYARLWNFWDVFDLSYLRNPAFLVFAMSNFLLHIWYHVPYIYSAEHGLGMGFDNSIIDTLISIPGILVMFGEVILGRIGDCAYVNPSLLYAACIVLCGLVTLTYPLLTTYLGLAVASGTFGGFVAANYSLTSAILVENITLEKFTNAYGFLLLVQGLAYLIGPPLSGWLFDNTGSYKLLFYLSGSFIALSGVMVTAVPLYRAARRSHRRQKPTTDGNVDAIILKPIPTLSEDDTHTA